MHLLQRSLPSGLQVYSKPSSDASTGESSARSCRFISSTFADQSSVNCTFGNDIIFCPYFCVRSRLQMENKNWFGWVSVPERCCRGSRGRTYCGLSPDPLPGQNSGQGHTGGPGVFFQTCRSASLWDRASWSTNRKSTSRWARKQSHTSNKELLAKGPQRQHKHSFTTHREDREEAEIELQNSRSSLWCDREKCSESAHRTAKVCQCSVSNPILMAATTSSRTLVFFPATFRLEQELRRLKSELQASRQSEQELRSHICNLTNSERSLRPEVSLLRQSNVLLQSKWVGLEPPAGHFCYHTTLADRVGVSLKENAALHWWQDTVCEFKCITHHDFFLKQILHFVFRIVCLTKTKQKDKQSSAMLEKKTRAETEARLYVEKQLADLQAQKLEEAANTARSLTSR